VQISVVIPAYNEAACIKDVLEKLTQFLQEKNIPASIIVVDDGSEDGTAAEAKSVSGVKVIKHAENRGYGAALKTGIRAAETEWVLSYDADSQHTPDLLPALVAQLSDEVDMVVGKREGYKGPLLRQPGKLLLSWVVNFLTDTKVPDFNSGLRAFRRSVFLQYMHLFPNTFSLSTTSTVCFLKEGKNVRFVPIIIQPRNGKSTVRARDAARTFMLILRLIMLFSPLRIFLPLCVLVGLTSLGLLGYELVVHHNVSDGVVMLMSLTATLFFFGLISDQVAAVRRELRVKSDN